jgi:uncharacterized membrane protein YdjX (TVP38/TMEM64 family)
MFFSRNNATTHFIAVASATTAVVGLRFDDVKWAVTIIVSLIGSAVALYIFRGEMREHAETRAHARNEFERLRALFEHKSDDLRRGTPSINGDRGSDP